MADRLDAERLLTRSESDRQRALAIIRNLCRETEASAQHETGKEEVLDNRFLDPCREAGNKRLKKSEALSTLVMAADIINQTSC